MYAIIKDIHNVLRWIVLLLGLWAVVRVWWGLLKRREWAKWDRRAGVFFSSALDVQLLLGVVLYFISPLIQIAYQDFGAAMAAAGSRFFTVEHVIYAGAALMLAHLGNASTKKAPTNNTRFRRAALLFTLALAVLLLGVPWPWLEVSRPLLPGFLTP